MSEEKLLKQKPLIQKINRYLELHNSRYKEDRLYFNPRGICAGLIGIYSFNREMLFYKLRILSSNIDAGSVLFEDTMEEKESFKLQKSLYELIVHYQWPDESWPEIRQYDMHAINDKLGAAKLYLHHSIVCSFDYDALESVLKILDSYSWDENFVFRVDSIHHTIMIKKNQGRFELYNPNFDERMDAPSLELLGFHVMASFASKNSFKKIFPLAIDVYSSQEKKIIAVNLQQKIFDEVMHPIFRDADKLRKKNICEKNIRQSSVLHLPALRGNVESFKFLYGNSIEIISKEDMFKKNKSGNTPLHLAAQYAHVTILRFCIEKNINVLEFKDLYNNNLLHFACNHSACSNSLIFISRLLGYIKEHKLDINFVNDAGDTPLHFAVFAKGASVCEALIKAGAKVDCDNKKGQTPLHCAILSKNKWACETFIKAGAKVDFSDKEGQTPLHLAASVGQIKICELLIEKNAQIDALDNAQHSLLYFAVQSKNFKLIKLLVEKGATVNDATLEKAHEFSKVNPEEMSEIMDCLSEKKSTKTFDM
jgi:ankyrin repeat protein